MSRKSLPKRKSGANRTLPTILVDTSDDSEFEVEAILDKRIISGKVSVSVALCVVFFFVFSFNSSDFRSLFNCIVLSIKLISKMCFIRFQTQYLIKYKGYDDSENTWEPKTNLNCPKIIREFERSLLRKKKAPEVRQYFEYERILAKRTVDGNMVCISI